MNDPGFLVWLFILGGNFAAIVALSTLTAGGTSSMGQGGYRTL